MPVQFDSPVAGAGRVTFDAPAGGGVVFDEPSPYAVVIAEAKDFQRRAAANTLEAIGREATAPPPSPRIPISLPGAGQISIPYDLAQTAITVGPRVGLPLATAVGLGSGVGTLPTLAALVGAGGAGEFLGQLAEKSVGLRDEYSPAEVALNAALTPVTVGPLRGVTSPLVRMGIRGAEGAALAGVQDIGTRAIRGEEQNLGETLRRASLPGAILGSVLGTGEFARPAAVAERMAGKSPEAQLDILNQEMKLAGDTLTPREQRIGLDTKIQLEGQIEARKAAEQQAKAAQDAASAQQKAVAESQRAIAEAQKPPELPESARILAEPVTKAPSIANVATEIATQTKNSPYALQEKLNQMTAVPEPVTAPAVRTEVAPPKAADADILAPATKLPTKAEAIKQAIETPETVWQYTVFRPGEGLPDAVQVDAIIGDRNAVSSNPADLRKAGGDIPDVPKWVPQGKYTLEQINALIKQGEPNALREQTAAGRVLRGEATQPELDVELRRVVGEDQPKIAPQPTLANQARDALREGPMPQPLSEAQFLASQAIPEPPIAGRSAEATRAAAIRRQQRGAVPTSVITPIATGAAGATVGFAETERQPGETEEAFQARRLRNALIGAGAGATAGVAIPALAKGAQQARARETKAPLSARVEPPTPGEGQGVRQTAEKMIENRQYPERLRQVLAEDPSIIYDKFALSDLGDRVTSASPQELADLRASPDQNARVAATIELANRYSVEDRPEEAAALYAEASRQFTAPAQLINVARLVRSPQAFVRAVNEQLKDLKRTLSKPQEEALTALAAKTIKAEQELARAERMAEEDFSQANEAAYRAAQKQAAEAKKNVDDFVHQVSPESFGDITSKIIQGNLLTPLSLVANVFGNMVYQPVRRGATSVATVLDAIYAGGAEKPRTFDRAIPLPTLREIQAAGDGIKIAGKELLTGPSADSYIKSEVQRGFRPLRSLAQAFTGKNLAVREDGSVALTDRAKKFIEGTLGAPAEVMFRFLNLGDKPFRRAAEAEILLEQARLRGLKGRNLDRFLEFPDEATRNLIDTEGRRAIFAQENKGITKLNQFLDSGIAQIIGADKIPPLAETIKVFNRIVVPFRQFPVNYVMTALNFAAPELAVAKSAYYAQKGDRRKALQSIGEGTLGAMMYGAANFLWDKGIISEPTDKDAKQRTVQYEQMGPQRINITGLNRALDGGDGTYRLGDTTMDWGRLGIPASVFYVFTRNASKGKKDYARLGQTPPSNYAMDRLGAIPGMSAFALDQSFLSGTSAFLEAMRNPDPEGQELQNWARNAFRAVTSIAVPNSVEALARAQYQYIPELKGDNLTETLKNTWDYKTLQLPEGDRAILKRGIWGEPIERTPAGKNPYVNQFLDVTRAESKAPDKFKQTLIDLYKETGTPDVYPTPPERNITLQGITVKLEPQDYEDLQELVGKARRQYAQRIVDDPRFKSDQTIPEGKILALKAAYSEGARVGQSQLLAKPGIAQKYFGELLGQPPPPPEASRVISRDPKARGRLRMEGR